MIVSDACLCYLQSLFGERNSLFIFALIEEALYLLRQGAHIIRLRNG